MLFISVSPVHSITAHMNKELVLNGVSKLNVRSFDLFGREFDSSSFIGGGNEDEEEMSADFGFFLVNGEDRVLKLEKNNVIRGVKVFFVF